MNGAAPRLIDEARHLLGLLEPRVPEPTAAILRNARRRLDEPLRVAIAGRVKAGKSTLLNAIIGQAAAATDTAECTRAVTWYIDGTVYRAWVRDREGGSRQVPYRRSGTAALIDLDGVDLNRVERVDVEFPSQHLRAMTLIDTPGIASVSEQVAARAADFLIPDHGDQGADVVVYLLRHVHERDADFLEAFTDPAAGRVGAVRSIGVLSRADEVGNGRGDALRIAHRVAARYAAHPLLRPQVADVLPVAGLLAFTAATITEDEFGRLVQLARLSQLELDRLLTSADLLLSPTASISQPVAIRRELVDRLGMFGLRLATALIRSGTCPTADSLAEALEHHSGIQPLRQVLLDRFAGRADVLKASRAIDLVGSVVARMGPDDGGLRRDLERVAAGSHELAELRCLADVQGGSPEEALPLEPGLRLRALAALGAHGTQPWHRLQVDEAAGSDELIAAALDRVDELRLATSSPFVGERAAEVLRVALRSVEAVHFRLMEASRTLTPEGGQAR